MSTETTPPAQLPPGESSFHERIVGVAAVIALVVLVAMMLAPFVRPLAWAVLFAAVLMPTQVRLSKRLGDREGLSALLLCLLLLVIVLGPLSLLAVQFLKQATEIAARLQSWATTAQIDDLGDLAALPILKAPLQWIEANTFITVAQIREWAQEGSARLVQPIASLGGRLFSGAFGTLLSIVLTMFVLFFLLRDGRRIVAGFAGLIPLSERHRAVLFDRFALTTRAVISGTLMTAVVQGILLGIGFVITGLPGPVVFGVAGAVLSVVPVGGTAIVWVPAVLLLFSQGDYGMALFMLVWGIVVVSSVDNFLKPLLIGGQAEVPTLAVFLGVIGGLAAFGPVGMFLGPVILAMALTLLAFAREALAPPADTGTPGTLPPAE